MCKQILRMGAIVAVSLLLANCGGSDAQPEAVSATPDQEGTTVAPDGSDLSADKSADPWAAKVGQEIEVEGTAYNQKLGAVVKTESETLWLDGVDSWPDDLVGKTVTVRGVLAERHDLPVFVHKPDEPIRSGMPVPEETDLEAASRRLVVENPVW